MTSTEEPISRVAEMSLQETRPGVEKVETPSPDSSSGGEKQTEAADVEQGTTALSRVVSKFGERPECFANTLQEVSFVFMATVATATTSFLAGTGLIITVPVSHDLGMNQGQIAWITASTS